MKICEHCGAQLHTGGPVCGRCGNPAKGIAKVRPGLPDAFDALSLLFCGVAVALVVFGFVSAGPADAANRPAESAVEESAEGSGGVSATYSTPEEVAKNYLVSLYTGDAETYYTCPPWFCLRSVAAANNIAEGDRAALARSGQTGFGGTGSSCTVNSALRYMDQQTLSKHQDALESYGMTASDVIQDTCLVAVDLTLDGKTDEIVVFCVKMDGNWYAVISEKL